MNLKRLSFDWPRFHAHPVVLAEVFMDCSRLRGPCYRAAWWKELGKTGGFSKVNRQYRCNGQPKLIFVRPLVADAPKYLCAHFLPPVALNFKEVNPIIDINRLPPEGEGGLMELLNTITDPRKPRGVRHPVATVLVIATCAVLCGTRSFCAVSELAQGLSLGALKKIGAKRSEPPSEPTIRRILQNIDVQEVDTKIG